MMLCNYQPTAENMLIDMVNRIQPNLPNHIALRYARLQETDNSFVEWFAEEN
jgi:6-pyruvoyltetrahydropterin/6-carboxytetrahydropterin synthase